MRSWGKLKQKQPSGIFSTIKFPICENICKTFFLLVALLLLAMYPFCYQLKGGTNNKGNGAALLAPSNQQDKILLIWKLGPHHRSGQAVWLSHRSSLIPCCQLTLLFCKSVLPKNILGWDITLMKRWSQLVLACKPHAAELGWFQSCLQKRVGEKKIWKIELKSQIWIAPGKVSSNMSLWVEVYSSLRSDSITGISNPVLHVSCRTYMYPFLLLVHSSFYFYLVW